jgi:hypothetical protein
MPLAKVVPIDRHLDTGPLAPGDRVMGRDADGELREGTVHGDWVDGISTTDHLIGPPGGPYGPYVVAVVWDDIKYVPADQLRRI